MRKRLFVLCAALAATLVLVPVAPAGVKIFQIQYDPPGRDTGTNAHLNLEFVYLWNTSRSRAVQLSGWTLRDAQGHVFRFPAYRLRGGEYLAVATGKGRNRRGVVHWRRSSYVWDNRGDTATIKRRDGTTASRCSYRGSVTGTKKCYRDVPSPH
jgi:hypothetical protein